MSVSSTGSASSTTSTGSLGEKRHSSPPPPSTSLPAPVTEKDRRPKTRPLRAMAAKVIIAICTIIVLWRCLFSSLSYNLAFGSRMEMESQPDLFGGDELPDEPTALVVSDHDGEPRWTVSIPHNLTFPLRSRHYQDICTQAQSLRDRLGHASLMDPVTGWRSRNVYDEYDPTFLDIGEAEEGGALPRPSTASKDGVCERSFTFAMDTDDASFGKTLLMLWLSYGLAKREDRAFFIDDSRWPYGKYTSYFAPPPAQACSPPSAHHALPCPHSAKHLLVSAATVPWTFGPAFLEAYQNARKYGHDRNREIYNLIRTGYDDLFQLIGDDASYATSRIADMKQDAASHGGSVVGMHIRRGDLHPYEYQFSRDYLPLSRYALAARSIFRAFLGNNEPSRSDTNMHDFTAVAEYIHSPLLLASDDPDVLASPELSSTAAPFEVQKAQERIVLATKATLDQTSPVVPLREEGSAYVKHVDENSGWEGGFYSALFYSLGGDSKRLAGGSTLERLTRWPGEQEEEEPPVPEHAMRMRELVGRAYLLDLAVLGRSDGVVCAVSSATCRILGVMLGWEGVKGGRWLNVDDGRPWSWDGKR